MLFNSLQFFAFFAVVYVLYLQLGHKWQNRMLLVASYFFYGSWDWRFLSLIFISTVLDYFCGLGIAGTGNPRKRRFFVSLSVIGNLSILGFFKYFNFFAASLERFLMQAGLEADFRLLHIVLPVGISFYTFQTMSYTIDVYRGQLKPTRNFLDYALFVSFFPQLVAGPIERASHLLQQVLSPRIVTIDKFYEGAFLISWGIFKKVFVADNLARIVTSVFALESGFNGAEVLIGLYAFAFQIYCDFSGYSDIARGIGKCMGFDIMVNFNLPYFSRNPGEFWRRWHISLSTWLRDYLYIPLGGNRKGNLNTYRNLALTMFLGGLWHGAAWTFVMWGVFHGSLLIAHRLMKPVLASFAKIETGWMRRGLDILNVIVFFHITCIGWLLFRAQWGRQAVDMFVSVFTNFDPTPQSLLMAMQFVFFTFFLIAVQIWQYARNDLMVVYKANAVVRGCVYAVMIVLIGIFGVTGGEEFIYFQF
ncbi:MAG: MBOAT family protein [Verrucomicrobia bacterium]|nr:MBOAT family protein [Verrucomicrobiota bacterium]